MGQANNQIPEDLRLPENLDDDFSEPNQVDEFEADRHYATHILPSKTRSIARLVGDTAALLRAKKDVNNLRNSISVKCEHKGCSADATHFIHEQKLNKLGKEFTIPDSSEKNDENPIEPIGFSCAEHAGRFQGLRNLVRYMTDRKSEKYYDAQPEDQRLLESTGLHTAATPISDYIHLTGDARNVKHSIVSYPPSEEDPRTINGADHYKLYDAYADKVRQHPKAKTFFEKYGIVKAAELAREKMSNRIKGSQSPLLFRGKPERYSVRDLVTGPSGQPSKGSERFGPLLSSSRVKEVFGDPEQPEKSISPGRRAQSDLLGYTHVAGISSHGEELNKVASEIDDLVNIKPEEGEFNVEGGYEESPYDVYSKSFPKISKHSKKRRAKVLYPVFKSAKWRLTSAGGTNALRAVPPSDVTERAREEDRARYKLGVTTGGKKDLASESINEYEGEGDDSGTGTRRQMMLEGVGSDKPPRHEITGSAANDWDVRFYSKDAPYVVVNKNNRVVHADFVPHRDEDGEEDWSKGYWLATGQRVRHESEPRYLAPEDIQHKPSSLAEIQKSAEKLSNVDHSDCVKNYVKTEGAEGHLDDEEGRASCKKADLGPIFKGIFQNQNPSTTRLSEILSFNRRAGVDPTTATINRPPARLLQARETTSTFSHQPCYANFLRTEGAQGHDNTEEARDTCEQLKSIKDKYL